MKSHLRLGFITAIYLSVFVFSYLPFTNAAARTWTGSVSSDWTVAANWDGGLSVPSVSDDIVIPAGCLNYPDLTSNITIKSLTINQNATFTQTSGTLLVKGGQTTISGNFIQNGGTFLTDFNVAINSSGSLSVSGTFHLGEFLASDPTNNLSINGSLNQSSGIINTLDLNLNIGGTYSMNANSLDVYGGFTNYSTINLNSGNINLRGSILNLLGSNFNIAGADVSSFGQDWLVQGDISISSGSLSLKNSAGSAISGVLQLSGGSINQSGGLISAGEFRELSGSTYSQSNGDLLVNGDFKVVSGNIFNSTGGILRLTGSQTESGSIYSGNIQLFELIIETEGNLLLDQETDLVKIAGNLSNYNSSLDNVEGTLNLNGTNPQSIYSESTPASTSTLVKEMIVGNSSGVELLNDLGVDKSFSLSGSGLMILNEYTLFVNSLPYSGPLPVELNYFSAIVNGSNVQLKWKTESEVNNFGFEILRSSENNKWIKIGFVSGSGNSNSPKSYSFSDNNVERGIHSYKLKQIDNDGLFSYSKIVEVEIGLAKEYKLEQNYPNPFNPNTLISFSLPEAGFVKIKLYNLLGEEIKILLNDFREAGVHQLTFNAVDLESGIYLYQLETSGFNQVRKMILLK
jgi:hypothetical protein